MSDAESNGVEPCCKFCDTPRSDFATRSSFETHLIEEHPEECLDWLLSDWQRNFSRALSKGVTSTHDTHWEFIEKRDSNTASTGT